MKKLNDIIEFVCSGCGTRLNDDDAEVFIEKIRAIGADGELSY